MINLNKEIFESFEWKEERIVPAEDGHWTFWDYYGMKNEVIASIRKEQGGVDSSLAVSVVGDVENEINKLLSLLIKITHND